MVWSRVDEGQKTNNMVFCQNGEMRQNKLKQYLSYFSPTPNLYPVWLTQTIIPVLRRVHSKCSHSGSLRAVFELLKYVTVSHNLKTMFCTTISNRKCLRMWQIWQNIWSKQQCSKKHFRFLFTLSQKIWGILVTSDSYSQFTKSPKGWIIQS